VVRHHHDPTLFPYTTLFRSADAGIERIYDALLEGRTLWRQVRDAVSILVGGNAGEVAFMVLGTALGGRAPIGVRQMLLVNMFTEDRKSTRLNSSHQIISYAV